MYVDSSNGKPKDIARLYSPIEPATTGKCLSFWYHMNGQTMGTLSVYLSINDIIQTRPLWSETGNKGDVWRIATMTLTTTDTFEVNNESYKFEHINYSIINNSVIKKILM